MNSPAKNSLTPQKRTRMPVVSLAVDVSNINQAAERIVAMAGKGSGGYICMSTVHMVMESHDRPRYAKRVNSADLVLPDGMPLVWMEKIQGAERPGRVRANDLMIKLFGIAESKGLTIGFYGSTDEVLEGIKKRAALEFPDLKIVYSFSPPFRELTAQERDSIKEEIQAKAPQILFVGLGCPKQEIWMNEHRNDFKSVSIGVGASFDFYAGNVREAPGWLQMLGLEWLFRLFMEPKRLWKRYLVLNPRFMALAVSQLVGFRKSETERLRSLNSNTDG